MRRYACYSVRAASNGLIFNSAGSRLLSYRCGSDMVKEYPTSNYFGATIFQAKLTTKGVNIGMGRGPHQLFLFRNSRKAKAELSQSENTS